MATKKKASSARRSVAKPKPKARAKPIKVAASSRKKAATAARKPKAAASNGKGGIGLRRRDSVGHLDATYAADLHDRSRASSFDEDTKAFLRRSKSRDDLAEQLGEQLIKDVTSGENQAEDSFDQDVPEERGGPFVETTGKVEFAKGIDPSNPKGAKREPFPRT